MWYRTLGSWWECDKCYCSPCQCRFSAGCIFSGFLRVHLSTMQSVRAKIDTVGPT